MAEVQRFEIEPGYTVSRLLKGGWHLAGGHGNIDHNQAIKDMASFVEAGITTFDCADHYTGVEEMIGDFRAAHPSLAPLVQVHTKFVPDYDSLGSVDRAYVESIIDRSLKRLRVERLDLVQYYWWDPDGTPGYVEAALVLEDLRKAGKIARIGVSNFSVRQLRAIVEAGVPVATNQPQYSPIDLRPEKEMVTYSQGHGIHQLCYGTLAGGFFAERWLGAKEPNEPLENRSLTKYKLIIEDFGGWGLFQYLLAVLKVVADRQEATIGQVALRWILDRPGVAGAIVGATSTRHLAENLKVFDVALTPADRAEIAAMLDRSSGLEGDCYDLERDKTGRHGNIMRYNQNQGRV
jgi:aryl-alcohol dehydrogenase-like predicted oxidoreductase